MSSSVWEICGWVVEEVAPDVLVTLDGNEPISAPIKLGRWLLFIKIYTYLGDDNFYTECARLIVSQNYCNFQGKKILILNTQLVQLLYYYQKESSLIYTK